MAALSLTVDSLDGVEEALKPLYVQDGEKFKLNVDLPQPEDTTGLKTALQKERKAAADLAKQTKQWEKLGKTPDEIQQFLDEREAIERKKAEDAGDHAKILKQHQDKWAKERSDLEAELNAARSSERGAIIGTSVTGALTKEGVTEEGVDLLPDRLASRIKFDMIDGKRVLKITQADGESPMAGSGPEGAATIDDLVKEAKTKWPSLFKGTGQSGSGMPPSTGGGGNPQKRVKKSELQGTSPEARAKRVAFINEHGLKAYEALSG